MRGKAPVPAHAPSRTPARQVAFLPFAVALLAALALSAGVAQASAPYRSVTVTHSASTTHAAYGSNVANARQSWSAMQAAYFGLDVPFGSVSPLALATVAPSVTSFTPTSGAIGTSLSITGKNLSSPTSVKFNGTAASFTPISSTS